MKSKANKVWVELLGIGGYIIKKEQALEHLQMLEPESQKLAP